MIESKSMPTRPIVLLLIPHLGGGGAERVAELLARHLSREKYELHLGLVTQGEANPLCLPTGVIIHYLHARRVRSGALPVIRLVRSLRPKVILSSMAHLNFMVLLLHPLFPSGTRILVRQNGTVSSMIRSDSSGRLRRFLYKHLYPRADRVICQSRSMAEDLHQLTGIDSDRLAILLNPIESSKLHFESTRAPLPPSHSQFRLFTAGRLSREKGYDLLLEAVSLLSTHNSTVTLDIAGQGPEESALHAQCNSLGLEGTVCFLGYQPSLASHFARADLFVLSSRHEGMPNVLLEAAAAGLPIVATPACGGLVDQLRDQPGVWLAKEITAAALAEALAKAIPAVEHCARIDHQWVLPFLLENAIPEYEALIDATLGEELA